MTERQFFELLKKKYDPKAYALIPQVRNATGFQARVRTADAIGISLWPSRGIDVLGFEFKDSRSDWLRELKNPEKAEEIGRFCAYWWIVASKDNIVAAWRASCGQMAIAAILRWPVAGVRHLFPGFRGWTTPTMMFKALQAAGATATDFRVDPDKFRLALPTYGLAFLQWSGGWWDNRPAKVQYRFTHWIASFERRPGDVLVYDGNADGWIPRREWTDVLFPEIAKTVKCTGVWVRQAWEVAVP